MAGKVKTICEEKISPIIEEMGYEVVDIEYSKKSDGMNLIFYIDNENGVNIEDCEKVSKVIVCGDGYQKQQTQIRSDVGREKSRP